MSIKISKAAKDLNVGTQTLIEFLSKKNITVDLGPNARISEEHYDMLVREFKSDMDTKLKSEMFSSERQKEKKSVHKEEKKQVVEEIKPEIETIQQPKVVGKINLDELNKKPEQQVPVSASKPVEKEQAQPITPIVEKKVEEKPEPKVEKVKAEKPHSEKPQPKPHTEKSQPKPQVQPQSTPKVEIKKQESEPLKDAQPKADAPKVPAKDEIFTLGRRDTNVSINVVGKIDLSAINQSTRPKKKTKEERRTERIQKEKSRNPGAGNANPQGGAGTNSNNNTNGTQQSGNRTKRKRIGTEKVDIEKSANQIQQPRPQRAGEGAPRNRNNNNNGNGNSGNNNNNSNNNNNNQGGGRFKNRRPVKPEVNEVDVQKQVKETLARLTSKTQKKGTKWRKERRVANNIKEREAAEMEAAESKILKLTEFVTANDLAVMMDVHINKVIATCMSIGVMVSINQRLDAETINIVAEEFGFKTEYVSAEVVESINAEEDSEEDMEQRPPIVTVMGHVDHGKTSLLDYIRSANVIAGEAGGITQHIGAYNVKLADGRRITFLDTPGHEAFTAMRARGAKVTDIVIIIVAADDNVMPQTVEAINHASAAGVPIIFAINKIDKPAANPDKIKEELANMNYLVEEWGGKYQSQEISAKKGIGIDELMEKVLLEAEMLDLKANPNRRAVGSIIESSLDKGRGFIATMLVETGTLNVGDIVLAGTHYGKVKAMFNERNQRIKQAGPSAPALILGLNGAPTAGDKFNVMDTDQEAREIASKREQLQRELGIRTQTHLTLEEIGRRRAIGNFKELNIIVKGDVDGSIEALSDSLIKLSTPEIQVNVLHKAVGAISESDITLAAASDAIIIGFQVRPSVAAKRLAEKEGVDIRLYSIIYAAIEEVTSAMEGMLAPEIKEEIVGSAEVLQTYHISKVGTIAGAIVREGKVRRNCKIRLIRDGIVKYTGDLGSLKRFKDDVKEVASGYDCGLNIAGYNDIKEGDIIEAFEEVEVKKSL
ncbi:MAG: translation initiation factor IF-2 [Muribaculaceae bacterium]|nr:translation initiation factor IF-2 [Muribaculaceae bacterium]